MLKMRYSISRFFQLILGVLSKLTPDTVMKALEVFKILLKESFEVAQCNKNKALVAVLMLGLPKANNAIDNWDNK